MYQNSKEQNFSLGLPSTEETNQSKIQQTHILESQKSMKSFPKSQENCISLATSNANWPAQLKSQYIHNGVVSNNSPSLFPRTQPIQLQQSGEDTQPINGNQITGGMQKISLESQPMQQICPLQNGQNIFPANNQSLNPPVNRLHSKISSPQSHEINPSPYTGNKSLSNMLELPQMPSTYSKDQGILNHPSQPNIYHNRTHNYPTHLNNQNLSSNNTFQTNKAFPQSQASQPIQVSSHSESQEVLSNINQKVQQAPPTFCGKSSFVPLQYQAGPKTQFNQQAPMGFIQQGFNRLWGQDTIDLMQSRHILNTASLSKPKIVLNHNFHESVNCNPDIMRCTVAKIPESKSLLDKTRLPLGLLVHPFRDINSLPVIQCPNIVRCRLCRTYINPFVYFTDTKTWKCNLCYRVNELPEDFQFDPATKTYGDVTRRPEVRSSTIEFIAPSEYMLRPPQPAIYLFLFDVSLIAQQSGYLENVCCLLSKHLDDMPGDTRTQVGFIAYNSEIHFYGISEGYNQPHEMTVTDNADPFLPCPENLLINLEECKELIKDLLSQLPKRFSNSHDSGSALGAALQVAYKLMMASGGRVTVFQTCLPTKGIGALTSREDPNNRSGKDIAHLNPSTDFYKRHALECSGYQIAIDLFLLNQQYSDMATMSGMSKHSGGCVYHFPLYQKTKKEMVDSFAKCFHRYLTRKIGFEAVMRIRCTRGLQVHTFHGNFFVRSTDLLSLPNINPDAGYGMQISYDESLTDVKTICFQTALLYTNSEGERRIRVHTLCLPVSTSLSDIIHSADSIAIVGLLAKMAVDRSLSSNLSDARDAFINATIDILSVFRTAENLPGSQSGQLMAPVNLTMLPLYILALLKHTAFRIGTSTRLDDRVFAMDLMKTLPLDQLIKYIYPEFYNLDSLFFDKPVGKNHEEGELFIKPNRLQLSAEFLDSRSMFLMDSGNLIIIYVGLNVPNNVLKSVLGISTIADIPDYLYDLPDLKTHENITLWKFISGLNEDKPFDPIIQIIRETSTARNTFYEKLIDDRNEASLSYYEFLQHLRNQVK